MFKTLRPVDDKHWFWSQIKKHKRLYFYVGLASILINIFALVSPLYIMNVYDRVIPAQAMVTGWVLGIGALTIFAFDFMIRSIRTQVLDNVSIDIDRKISRKIFSKILNVRLSECPPSSGVMANLIKEFDHIREFFSASSVMTLVDLPFAFLFLLIIGILDIWIAVALFIVMAIMLVSGIILNHRLIPLITNHLRFSEHRHGLLIETIQNLETIKTLGGADQIGDAYQHAIEQYTEVNLKTRDLSALNLHIVTFLRQALVVLIVLIGMYGVKAQTLSIGALIACVILASRAVGPITQAAGLLVRYNHVKMAFDALDKFMSKTEDRQTGDTGVSRSDIKGGIRFEKITFEYPQSEYTVLDRVSFQIKAGEKLGIIGRIGSGKSTIARLIVSLYDAQSGAIFIDETDHRHIAKADLTNQIGYVAQDVKLMTGSLLDNIVIGDRNPDAKTIEEIVNDTGLSEFVSRHPLGMDAPVGEGGSNLSGGQRQLVALARALIMKPKILVCDEPTNAMDVQMEARFSGLIEKYCKDTTLVMITHRQSLLGLVDRLLLVEKGQVIMDDKRDAVLKALQDGKIKVRR